jgi:daunorubicin resistance ABC transporter ATP-binding subunit
MTQPMLEVTGAVKAFGTVTALNGVDLAVPPGRIAALLGPNGAGKTTLVRIVATLVRPDAGVIRVAGYDVVADPYAVRARIGLTGQYAGLDEALSGRANLMLIGRLAGLRRQAARGRAAELTDRFDLAAAAGRPVGTYSGGMRRRADLAASLMARPSLLVLDEPTTGLDPAGRRQVWESLAALREEGTAMLLTTQYLEEAERLADLVHILDQGRMVASGTPAQLRARTGTQLVEARFEPASVVPAAARALAARLGLPPDGVHADPAAGWLTVVARDGVGTLLEVAQALAADGFAVADLGLRGPTLDEAFLALTGQHAVGRAAS